MLVFLLPHVLPLDVLSRDQDCNLGCWHPYYCRWKKKFKFCFLMRHGITIEQYCTTVIKLWDVVILMSIIIIFIRWLYSYTPNDFSVFECFLVVNIVLFLLRFWIKQIIFFVEFRVYLRKHTTYVYLFVIFITWIISFTVCVRIILLFSRILVICCRCIGIRFSWLSNIPNCFFFLFILVLVRVLVTIIPFELWLIRVRFKVTAVHYFNQFIRRVMIS